MNVLIIQNGPPGELILTTPIIRAIKTELDANVDLLLSKDHHVLFDLNPYIHRQIDFNSSVSSIKKVIKENRYDWVIDLQNSFKTLLLRRNLLGKKLIFKKQSFKKWLYSRFKIDLLNQKHIVDRYFDLLSPMGLNGDNLGLDFYLPEKDEVENDWLPGTHQNGYIALLIGAKHATRKLPVNRLIELCDRINKPIILIGDSSEKEAAAEIESFFQRGTPEEEEAIKGLNKMAAIFNAVDKFNFFQQASLIKNASWVFTHDNDLMQVASAFKRNIYSIWGNTTPGMGRYPYRTQFTVFENNKIDCRPCTFKGYRNCPRGHFKCMNELTFDFYLPD